MTEKIPMLRKKIRRALLSDRRGFLRQLNRFKENDTTPIRVLEEAIRSSCERAQERRAARPKISYDPELPICAEKEKIARLIKEHQVVIVCGETGSGKSTQLPKICLEIGRGVYGKIGHTQPRRIAARTIARRVAEELRVELGQQVGFKVRFTDKSADSTLIKVMTDGVLLAESQTDPQFLQYDTIIIDEAHERSLNIDFLLGMMKRLLPRRRDLKLIITSATIDAKRFAEHFSFGGREVPIVEVSGRTYPIETVYRPLDLFDDDVEEEKNDKKRRSRKDEKKDEADLRQRALLAALNECARRGPGDTLIFLPTQRDILDAAKFLKKETIFGDDPIKKSEILPLYARLTFDEQKKIFEKSSRRKIVIATNVAESSLTVPGIRYVIDFGTARMSRYSPRSRTQHFPIEPISRASADQRAGRCGRVGPGYCVRLFSREDYLTRDEFTTPEIRRTNLASVILRTLALRLGDVEKFPFIDPPSRGTIADGYKTLFELGAIDKERALLPLGRQLAKLPVDPRIGRMILSAAQQGALPEMLVLAAALEIQDPRERPAEQAGKADLAHLKFAESASDFLSYLRIWELWTHWKKTLSGSHIRKACLENFLSFRRMREWDDLHIQLLRLVRDSKIAGEEENLDRLAPLPPQPEENERERKLSSEEEKRYNALHQSILSGLLIGIAQKGDEGEYSAALGGKFVLWPGSSLVKKKPSWVVAAERVETSRKFLRCCGAIRPEWIEPIASHLLEKSYFEPHWNRETGYVHAYQKVSLFGLTIVPKRRVNFGPIQPQKAREIFIQNALVEGEFICTLNFFVENQKLLDRARATAEKLRIHSYLKESAVRYQFYQERIPEEVYDAKSLKKWYSALPVSKQRDLFWTEEMICAANIKREIEKEYPDTLPGTDQKIPLQYRFEPGSETDGLTATVTRETFAKNDLNRAAGWLVPGLLEARVTALIKSLPKEIRRPLVPVPDTAREIVQTLPFGEGDFLTLLAREVSRRSGKLVTPSDFDQSSLARELKLNIRVVDQKGKVLFEGRDLSQIKDQLGVETRQTLSTVRDPRWTRDHITAWDFGTLPESVQIRRGNQTFTAYPGLTLPEGNAPENEISLRLFETAEEAARETRIAVETLAAVALRKETRLQAQWLPEFNRLKAIATTLPDFPFQNACARLITRCALAPIFTEIPRNEGEFNRLITEARRGVGNATIDITRWIEKFLEAYQGARRVIERYRTPIFTEVRADCRALFERLLPAGFYQTIPWQWLWEYPRYFQAVAVRYEGVAAGKSEADRRGMIQLRALWKEYEELRRRHQDAGIHDPQLEYYRWLLEEFTVSLFAQRLGTAVKVSAVRLEKEKSKIEGAK